MGGGGRGGDGGGCGCGCDGGGGGGGGLVSVLLTSQDWLLSALFACWDCGCKDSKNRQRIIR